MRLYSASRDQPAKHGLRLQAAIRLYFALKVSKDRRTYRRLLMDCIFWGCTQVIFSDFLLIIKLEWYSKAYIISVAFFGVLRTFFAKKVLSRRRQNRHRRFAKCLLYKHLARLTRKSQSSVASNYQSGFCSQGIKRPAYTPPAFDGL